MFHKMFSIIEEIFYKWLFSLTVLPRAVFRTQPKVYGGAFLQKYLTTFSGLLFLEKSRTINDTINVRRGCVPKTPLSSVKKKYTNYRIRFYIILYNFIYFMNYPVFIDIKLCIIRWQ